MLDVLFLLYHSPTAETLFKYYLDHVVISQTKPKIMAIQEDGPKLLRADTGRLHAGFSLGIAIRQ